MTFEEWKKCLKLEWWKQIKTNYEIAQAVIEIFEGIGQEAWQASAAAMNERCAEIAESYTPPDNMSYSTYDIGLKDASREIAQKIREQVVGD